MLIREQDRVRLMSRGGDNWARHFPLIVVAALKLPGALRDGRLTITPFEMSVFVVDPAKACLPRVVVRPSSRAAVAQ
jgi:hypothetical protein